MSPIIFFLDRAMLPNTDYHSNTTTIVQTLLLSHQLLIITCYLINVFMRNFLLKQGYRLRLTMCNCCMRMKTGLLHDSCLQHLSTKSKT